jgi:hypothetical protein
MDPQKHEEIRNQAISFRGGAILNAFVELDGIINKSEFARQYMEKTHSWFSQKLHECPVGGAKKEFTSDEAAKIAESFRDIAKRLLALADEIDQVKDID